MNAKVSVRSRIQKALLGLAFVLCATFTVLIFLVAFVIEDQVFINQLKLEQDRFETFVSQGNDPFSWRARNAEIRLVMAAIDLPSGLSDSRRQLISQSVGVHEYFNEKTAVFIANVWLPSQRQSVFIVYDVSGLLAVRGSKTPITFLLIGFGAFIMLLAIFIANKLTKRTLEPVHKLTQLVGDSTSLTPLQDMAGAFSADEVGVLAKELALALERSKKAMEREFEFNRGVSHELRSPIQVASSAIELLELNAPALLQHAAAARLKRSVDDMRQVAEAFLWLSSDRASQEHSCSVDEIRDWCKITWPDIPHLIAEQGAMNHHYPLPKPVMLAILRSLINNAVTHGETESIRISCSEQNIEVSNSYTVDATARETHSAVGFGVGQTITHRLCERFACQLEFHKHVDAALYRAELQMPTSKSDRSS